MFKLLITLLSIVFLIVFIYAVINLVKYYINQGYGGIEKNVVRNRNYRLLFETPENKKDLEQMISELKNEINLQESLSEKGIVEAEIKLIQCRKRLEQLNLLKSQFQNLD
jgi:hypothetical protein